VDAAKLRLAHDFLRWPALLVWYGAAVVLATPAQMRAPSSNQLPPRRGRFGPIWLPCCATAICSACCWLFLFRLFLVSVANLVAKLPRECAALTLLKAGIFASLPFLVFGLCQPSAAGSRITGRARLELGAHPQGNHRLGFLAGCSLSQPPT